jgi:hypothetical protein
MNAHHDHEIHGDADNEANAQPFEEAAHFGFRCGFLLRVDD